MADITYRLATPEDYNTILEFLRLHYFKDEPLLLSTGPAEQDSNNEESFMSCLYDGICCMAFSGDRIVGVSLCYPKYPNHEKILLDEASQFPNTNNFKILLLLASIEKTSNVFEKYNVDKTIHCMGTAVDREFRGKGIGLAMLDKTMQSARELGYPLYTIDCSSTYSARFCERLNMDLINVCPVADFRAPNNEAQLFFPREEHKLLKTYAKRLF